MKLVAEGPRWRAEIEPFGGAYRYQFIEKGKGYNWQEGFAETEQLAIAQCPSRLAAEGLLDRDELIEWRQEQ